MAERRLDIILGARDRATAVMDRFEAGVARLGRRVMMMGVAAGTAAATGMVALTRQQMQLLDETGKLGDQLEVNVQQLQGLQEVADRATRGGAANFNDSLERMTRRLGDAADGSGQAAQALDRMGVSFADIARLDPIEQFLHLSDAIQDVTSAQERNAIAQDLMGRSGRDMLGVMMQGREELERHIEASIESGRARTDEEIASIQDANEAYDELRAELRGLGSDLAVVVAPALQRWREGLTETVVAVRALDRETIQSMQSYAMMTATTTASLLVWQRATVVLGGLAAALRGVSIAAASARAVMMLMHTTLVGALVVGLGAVAAAFIRSRMEGIRFGEALLRIADDLGVIDSAAVNLRRTQDTLAHTTEQVEAARRRAAEADDPEDRVRAQQQLVTLLEHQAEAEDAHHQALRRRRDELKPMIADLREFVEDDSAFKIRFDSQIHFDDPDVRLRRMREELAEIDEQLERSGAPISQQLGEARDRLEELRDSAEGIAGEDLKRRMDEALNGPLAEAKRQAEELQQALDKLQPRFLDFVETSLEQQVRRIREEANALRDVAHLEAREGDHPFGETILAGRLAQIAEAEQRQATDLVRRVVQDVDQFVGDDADQAVTRIENRARSLRRGVESLAGAGLLSEDEVSRRLDQIDDEVERRVNRARMRDDDPTTAETARRGIDALELSARFTGLAAQFEAGMDPAARTADNTRRLLEVQEQSLRENRALGRRFDRLLEERQNESGPAGFPL